MTRPLCSLAADQLPSWPRQRSKTPIVYLHWLDLERLCVDFLQDGLPRLHLKVKARLLVSDWRILRMSAPARYEPSWTSLHGNPPVSQIKLPGCIFTMSPRTSLFKTRISPKQTAAGKCVAAICKGSLATSGKYVMGERASRAAVAGRRPPPNTRTTTDVEPVSGVNAIFRCAPTSCGGSTLACLIGSVC